ncbi:uncharacterized mitochondrial protein AtMg00810-like [Hibiscus syriacus]|uniref:uncharacterized mitochondrial protein AtMg00810-like n=1 Tax=Hibiscus syriacus TaxID=106335 RepID=UPI001921393D|nr:uncharacterized mitochondrial protein AtMg00810-like [Hibiscus syriacus]
MVLVYVDDLLLTGNDLSMIEELKVVLHHNFKINDLGVLKYFLGFEVLRSNGGILLTQRKYALEVIEDTGLGGAKPAVTPMEQHIKFTSVEYDGGLEQGVKDDELTIEKPMFQRLIGRLIYLTHTGPGIMYTVHHLSRFLQHPKRSHLEAAFRMVRYIKKDPGQEIPVASVGTCQLQAYCDADWGFRLMTRRSITGYRIKIGKSLDSWKSKKQNTIARSSVEAEYRSMAMTVSEVVWLRRLMLELGESELKPTKLYCDSKTAL